MIGIAKYRRGYLKQCRIKALKKSRSLYQPETKKITHYKPNGKINPDDYDAAVVGSDQVWHQFGKTKNLPYYYLSFMPPEKRISYAASFGFEEFPEKDLKAHQAGLMGMRFISCREESGCKLVEQITGKPGKLVLDPTLCIDRKIWTTLEEKPQYSLPEHYVLVFFMGRKVTYNYAIEVYAREHNLKIIDLFDPGRKDVWKTTLGGFLWLVHHADCILTDSFHCTVFSIIFEKEFTVFRRRQKGFEDMFSRVSTLLDTIGISDCEYGGDEILDHHTDYAAVKEKLSIQVSNSVDWLHTALVNVCE